MLDWVKLKTNLDFQSHHMLNQPVVRGEVYYCFFGRNIGSEQEKRRPCVILQNAKGNKFSVNTIVAPITHSNSHLDIVVPIEDKFDENGKKVLEGYALLGNIITVSKARLDGKITILSKGEMKKVDIALSKSIDLYWQFEKYERILKDKEEYIAKLKHKMDEKDKELLLLKAQKTTE